MTFEDRLRSVASEHSMPSNAKLDALGIDVDVTTLPTWADWERDIKSKRKSGGTYVVSLGSAESFAKRLAQDAMWRVTQELARALLYGDPQLIGKEIDT